LGNGRGTTILADMSLKKYPKPFEEQKIIGVRLDSITTAF